MNIWSAIPWDGGRVRVLVDFFAWGARGPFVCNVVVWVDTKQISSIDNIVTPFITTPNRQESLGSVKPRVVDGELVIG